jgi:hypothetical protein
MEAAGLASLCFGGVKVDPRIAKENVFRKASVANKCRPSFWVVDSASYRRQINRGFHVTGT